MNCIYMGGGYFEFTINDVKITTHFGNPHKLKFSDSVTGDTSDYKQKHEVVRFWNFSPNFDITDSSDTLCELDFMDDLGNKYSIYRSLGFVYFDLRGEGYVRYKFSIKIPFLVAKEAVLRFYEDIKKQ